MPDVSKLFFPDQPDFRMKRGLLAAAIAGGLLVAPACGDAQEQYFVTVIAGDDIGLGLAKTFEEGGFLSMDLGIALGDSASPKYGDIEGGFSLGPFTIAGILGLSVQNEGCNNGGVCVSRHSWEPERWHPVGFRRGVGAIVFVGNFAVGAKAIYGSHRGGRYSAWFGGVIDGDWLKPAPEDRRRAVSWPN